MKKLNFTNIAHYILIGVLTISIFLFFTPFLTFKVGDGNQIVTYGLNGIALLINNGKAQVIEGKNIIAYLENLFPRSNIAVSVFAILFVEIALELFNLYTKKTYKFDKYFNPVICGLSIINLALICCLKSSYIIEHFDFENGYGITLLIVFFVLAILTDLFLCLKPLIIKKK